MEYGGSLIRKEATGYGCVFFVDEMLSEQGVSLDGMICTISGSGNVAQYATEKVHQMGGKVVTLSDSQGFIYDPDGITSEKLAFVKQLKNDRRGRIKEYADHYNVAYSEGRPWGVPCDVAFPCATQNEINLDDAKSLVSNGCRALGEGANMPTQPDAVKYLIQQGVLFGPGKAANAGGVAVSGLEMTQNSMRLSWDRPDLEDRLRKIMCRIHAQCLNFSTKTTQGCPNYVHGANVAGFVKVADAMIQYGIL